jgi:predicted MFS family arabinose efflux permease
MDRGKSVTEAHPHAPRTGVAGPGGLRRDSRAVRVFAAVAGLCVSNLYYSVVLLPDIAASQGRPTGDFAALLALTQAGYAAGLLCLVPLGDILDRRRLTTLLLGASCAVLVVLPLTTGPLFLALFPLLGLFSVTAMILVPWGADLADDAERGRVVSTIMTGLILGGLLCRTFAGGLAQLASWEAVYWVSAALMALCAVAVRRVLPAGNPAHAPAGRGPRPGYGALLGSLPGILRTPGVGERCLYGALGFGAFSVFWTALPLRLEQPPFSYGPAAIGLFSLLGAAGVLGAAGAGRLADRGLQTPTTLAAFAVVGGTFLLMGAGPGVLALLILGTLLLDLAVQAAHITNQSVLYAGRPAIRSRITTVYMVSYFAGGAVGSGLAALVWNPDNGWRSACLLGACLAALALVVPGVRALAGRRAPRG